MAAIRIGTECGPAVERKSDVKPQRTALVVMARYPVAGAVKTRLARVMGAEAACEVYRAFLRDLDKRFAGGRRALVWAFLPPTSNFPALVTPGSRCMAQLGAELGERMHHCFRLLAEEGWGRILIIGVDAPHVREEWLEEAETALGDSDLVLGPAEDGGYYLIGMRAPHDVFSGVEMGMATVLAETVVRAERLGLRLHLLPQTFDVDEAADLLRLQQWLSLNGSTQQLPCTAALLQRWDGWLETIRTRRVSRS